MAEHVGIGQLILFTKPMGLKDCRQPKSIHLVLDSGEGLLGSMGLPSNWRTSI